MKFPVLLTLCLPLLCAWTLDIDIGEAAIGGGRSENIRIRALSDNGRDWQIRAQAPYFAHPQGRWQQLQAQATLHYRDGAFILSRPHFSARGREAPLFFSLPQELPLTQRLPLSPLSLHIGSGKQAAFLQLDWRGAERELRIEKSRLSAAQFNALLAFLQLPPLPDLHGEISPNLRLIQDQDGWRLDGNIKLRIRNWHSPDYLQAAENLNAAVNLDMHYRPLQGWSGRMRARIDQGETLIHPLYLNFSEAPLTAESRWQLRNGRLSLDGLQADDGRLHLSGGLNYDLKARRLTDIAIERFSGSAEALYQRYLKHYLSTDSLFADSEWRGSFYAGGQWRQGEGLRNAALVLHGLSIRDRQGRFDFPDIDGQIGQSGESRLDIAAATWRKLPLGASRLHFHWQGERLRLLEPWRIPILDGALVVNAIDSDRQARHLLDISLKPIDLAALSRALELPVFHGEISAELPEVRLSRDSLALNRPVQLKIFDGDVLISDLRSERFFSNQPLLYFSLSLDKLDLQRLTTAFDLAEIRGRVSGYIRDVALLNWQPLAFDAAIMTDAQAPGQRRISHEAVQLLTQLGGSSAAIGQFVRVLNSFPYDKLGFRAQLRGDRLYIDGVEAHPSGGFYLVKGSGLPHLDIIGHQHDSSYGELLARIKAALASEGPTIE